MSLVLRYAVRCDRCGMTATSQLTEHAAYIAATADGWKRWPEGDQAARSLAHRCWSCTTSKEPSRDAKEQPTNG